jgi:hypothetical protein
VQGYLKDMLRAACLFEAVFLFEISTASLQHGLFPLNMYVGMLIGTVTLSIVASPFGALVLRSWRRRGTWRSRQKKPPLAPPTP